MVATLQLVLFKRKIRTRLDLEHPPVRGEKMSKRLGGIKGCKYKTSSWHINGFPDGNNIGSTGEKPTVILYTYIKIRTHLDLLSIPRLWGKKCQNV